MALLRDKTLAQLTGLGVDLNFPSIGVPIDEPNALVFFLGNSYRVVGLTTGGSGATALNQLTDTQIVNPQTGEFFVRDGAYWKNKPYNLGIFETPSLGTPGQIVTMSAGGAPEWSDPFIGSFSLDSLTDVTMTGFNSAAQNVLVNTPGSSVFIPVSLASLTAKSFLNLTDTPATYGVPGQVPAINGSANGLVWSSPASGATTLLQLNDTPVAYGSPGQALVVNGVGDGTIWATIGGAGASTFLGLSDTPANYTSAAMKRVVVNDAGTGLVYRDDFLMSLRDVAPGTPVAHQGFVYDVNAFGSGLPGFKLQDFVRINLSNNPYAAGRALLSNGNDYVDTPVALLQPGITTGDLWYYDSALGSAVRLAAGPAGTIPMSNGAGLAPTFVDPNSLLTPPALAFTDLTDAPASLGSANQYVRMDGAGAALIFGDLPAYVPTTGVGVVSIAGLLPAAPTGFPQAVMRANGWSLSEIPPFQVSAYYQAQARVLMERAIWSRLSAGTASSAWNDAEKANWVRLVGLTLGTKVWSAGDVTVLLDDQAFLQFVTMNGSGLDRVTVGRISTSWHVGTEIEIHNLGPNEGTFNIDINDTVEGSVRLPVGHTTKFKARTSSVWTRMDALVIEPTITSEKSGTYTAKPNEIVPVNSTAGIRTVIAPSTALAGDRITVIDSRGTSSTNNITVDFVSAAALFHGTSENFILNNDSAAVQFLFVGGAIGWVKLS